MLLGVFILQHSAMKRLQLKERLQVGTGEKTLPEAQRTQGIESTTQIFSTTELYLYPILPLR